VLKPRNKSYVCCLVYTYLRTRHLKNNYDLIKYLTLLFLILFSSSGFSQNTEEKQFVIKKTSWEIFKDTIFVTKSHNGNSVPPTIELDVTENYKLLIILFKDESQTDVLKRIVSVYCDANKPKITFDDYATSKSPFRISLRTYKGLN